MIKHIVMIRLKGDDPDQKKQAAIELKASIDGLLGVVPELISMEVGLNMNTKPSAYDLVLTSEFKTMEDLDSYRVHPAHKIVLDHLYKVMDQTAVVDYDTEQL
jgi:hypothetical protein